MKKFITSVPFQSTINPVVYQPVNGAELSYDKAHMLPILNVLNNNAEKGEEIEVIFLIGDNEDIKRNYETVKEQLAKLAEEKAFRYTIREISYRDSDDISVMLEIYGKLIKCFEDNDELYTCITFGTKPVPLVQLMALRYAYHAKENIFIGSIVYGKAHGKKAGNADDKADIYDMTSLFYIDELSEKFCRLGIEEPEKKISAIIFGSEGENDE